jgi:peptidoglycan/LPS O-acetylase OafA/YrhL
LLPFVHHSRFAMSTTPTVADARMPMADAFKAVASQLIVLHHLAFYGPMTDHTERWLPALVHWLSQDARQVVQVFLVLSGFFVARSLAPDGVLRTQQPWALLGKRYVTIVLPCLAALGVAVLCTALAGRWMVHSSLPQAAGWGQFLAHALLVQGVLGMDSLSAGVWYVAIDFQLFALMLALLWVGRRMSVDAAGQRRATLALVAGGGACSVLWFNTQSAWDNWAVYFLGAHALGALAWWVSHALSGRARWGLAALTLAVVALALVVDFRSRLVLALATAVCLGLAHLTGVLYRWPRGRVWAYLGRVSYAVFLMNFPVALVVNAAFTRFAPAEVGVQTAGVVLAWGLTLAAGAAFFHGVEEPLRRWAKSPGWPLRLATLRRWTKRP